MDAFDLLREGHKGEAGSSVPGDPGQELQGHAPVSPPHSSTAQLAPAWAVVKMETAHHGIHFSLVGQQGQLAVCQQTS